MTKNKIMFIGGACVAIVAAVFFGMTTVYEDGRVEFLVKGRVFDN